MPGSCPCSKNNYKTVGSLVSLGRFVCPTMSRECGLILASDILAVGNVK